MKDNAFDHDGLGLRPYGAVRSVVNPYLGSLLHSRAMLIRSRSRSRRARAGWASLFVVLSLGTASTTRAAAPVRRPTPHQRLDAALAPLHRVLDELRVSAQERGALADLLARGEALAVEQVESRQRGEHGRAAAAERAMDLLARVARGRIEALRAEASADESERRATESEAHAQQARGALERAVERRMVVERDLERVAREREQQDRAEVASPTIETQEASAQATGRARRGATAGAASRSPQGAPTRRGAGR